MRASGIAAAVVGACLVGVGLPDRAEGAEGPVIRTLLQGSQSGIRKAQREVVKSQAEWEKLWKQHLSTRIQDRAPEPPKVDWEKERVLAVFLGARPTGGYALRIEGIKPEKGKLVVFLSERKPAPNDIVTQAFTAPFHMVAVPKFSGEVEWRPKP